MDADASLPVIRSLAELSALIGHDRPLHVRYSEGPEHDQNERSIDTESGLELPGLSANPLDPEEWWTRPLEQWLARQLCQYHELAEKNPDRYAWVLHGRVVGRGPDCEPLIGDAQPLVAIAQELLDEAESVYRRFFEAGRGPED